MATAVKLISGATGAGKSAALLGQYESWVGKGVRTDQILVMIASAARAAEFRQRFMQQEGGDAHGPLEVYSFYSFIQGELTLFWPAVQAAEASLGAWVRPVFLNVPVARQLMQGVLEPGELGDGLTAPPARIAAQLAGNLSTAAAAVGLTPEAAARKLAGADRAEKARVYEGAESLLTTFRARCLRAGMLDYGLSLELFSRVLMCHAPYLEYLRRRFRCLLVDDLDETTPAEQAFLALLAPMVAEAVVAYSTDGGHGATAGADPEGGLARFRPGATVVELAGSHTCSLALFTFSGSLCRRIETDGLVPATRYRGIVSRRIATDLRGEMVEQAVAAVETLVGQGLPPAAIAVLTPRPDSALATALTRSLGAVRDLRPGRRLIDDPYVRTIVTLAELVQPYGQFLPQLSVGALAASLQVLLRLDPIRASALAALVQRSGDLPEEPTLPDEPAARDAYRYLREWVLRARAAGWEADAFAQAALLELLTPLVGQIPAASLDFCRQLLQSAHRFRQARERFGADAFGPEYVRLLTEASLQGIPPAGPDSEQGAGGVVLATPAAYLSARLTSAVQVWTDLSSDAWLPRDVSELANPYVLAPAWPEGERWTDAHHRRNRLAAAGSMARAILRRCSGSIILAECSLSAWGIEQDGGLAEAFADLILEEAAPKA